MVRARLRRDQGISFFLANMTWLQPPGHVHTMISDSWAEFTLSFHADTMPANLTFNAQKKASGGLVFRAVNHGSAPLPVTVAMEGAAPLSSTSAEAAVSTLAGNSCVSNTHAHTPFPLHDTRAMACVFHIILGNAEQAQI
jgi:hypothetical protein